MNKTKLFIDEPDRAHFLDGIRGWASLMVLFSHLVVFFLANSIKEFQPWIFGILTDGNLAIFIFFVLSGFVLTLGYVQKSEHKIIVALALRRYPRLTIPIVCTCILVYLLAQNGLFFNREAGLLTKNTWLVEFYNFQTDILGCLKFATFGVFTYFDSTKSYNPVLWTMGIELWGSFVVFSIAALVLHLKKRAIILAIILLYLVLVNNIYYLPFVCGVCISIGYKNMLNKYSKIILYASPFLMALVVYYSCSTLRGGLFGLPALPRTDLLSIVASSIIVWVGATHVGIRNFFQNGLSRYLGSISFPLYLTHFVVLCSFSSYLLIKIQPFGWGAESSNMMIFGLSLVVCILVAHLFRYVETFAIQTARRISTVLMQGGLAVTS